MINVKLKDNKLINADFIKPEMVYAEFNEGLSEDCKREIVRAIEYGQKMMYIFESYRNNMHISNVVDMIEKMEKVYEKFDTVRFEDRRRPNLSRRKVANGV